jgi:hypothetical protein
MVFVVSGEGQLQILQGQNDIHRYQMVLKVLINILRLDQVGYEDTG